MKNLNSIKQIYNKLSNIGKILLFITLLLSLIIFFKSILPSKEGFTQTDKFSFKQGNDVYDNFYSNIYDNLVLNSIKNDYEITSIFKTTNPNSESIVVDVGCGTGHHVAKLSNKNLNVIGIDISQSMISKAKEKYPTLNFMVGDALDPIQFNPNSVTHILCLYFTIYYFEDKRMFLENCMNWLMPGGHLIIHLVNRETFDPILPPGNPLYIVSPQKYAKERITKTKIQFNDFTYMSNFNLDKNNNFATFEEKFKFKNGNVRKQQQKLFMEDTNVITTIAQECGFLLQGKIDLLKCAYENQYLYVFLKPG